MALFSSNHQPQSTNLVEFMAGKMFMRGKTVHPDPRKGTIYIHQTEDGLMHFCWKDASTNNVEDDFIIFPEDAEFVKVDKCTTGRVYLLSFKNQARKMFFWMQAFKTDKDEEHVKKVNDLINHPPAPNQRGQGGGAASMNDNLSMMNQLFSTGASNEDLQNAFAGVDRRQMMQLLNIMGSGGAGGANLSDLFPPEARQQQQNASATIGQNQRATVTASAAQPAQGAAATAGTGGGGGTAAKQPAKLIDAAAFSKILADVKATTGSGGSAAQSVDLENVLTAKNVEPVLLGKQEKTTRLLPHLPNEKPVTPDQKELTSTLRSPQFRQAVGMFGTALQSGQLGPIMKQFGLAPDVIKAFNKGDVQSVAEMLERQADGGESSTSSQTATSTTPSSDEKSVKKEEKKKDDKEKKGDATKPSKKDDAMDLD